MKIINIGLIGCGVVGSAVIRNITQHAEDIKRRAGVQFNVVAIAVKDTSKKRDLAGLDSSIITNKTSDVTGNPEVDIVLELMGGEDAAKTAIITAMQNGKHVATANKLLLAKHGQELYRIAEENGVKLGLEAAVAGAIPVMRTLKEAIAGGEIHSVKGIINGTANYILTEMTNSNAELEPVLKDAQRLGYAEADPTFDIEGIDAAHKIAIIASFAFGTPVDFNSIQVEGITKLHPIDFEMAKEFKKVIKLLGTAKVVNGKLDVRMHTAMLPCGTPLAHVNGVINAIAIKGSACGELFLSGAGAGGDATASAVIADMVEIARDMTNGCINRLASTGFPTSSMMQLPLLQAGEVQCGFYLRFMVEDKLGVMASITSILGQNGISISSAHQNNADNSIVPLMVITHMAKEANIATAVAKIDNLPTCKEATVIIRLDDGN